jgi:hypothetical protein
MERILGALDYRFRPSLKAEFGGALNGSRIRREAFEAVRQLCQLKAIVETGTYRGDTCEFFADSGLPVYSAELAPRFFGFSHARLKPRMNVHLFQDDSRSFLKKLAISISVQKSNVFFYLDAHWFDDLPLQEEVQIIFSHWSNAIIMIDDFQVPGDSGYKYDDYGNGRALTLHYLAPVAALGFSVFFPVAKSDEEVGLKRGWAILVKDAPIITQLRQIPLIREWLSPAP